MRPLLLALVLLAPLAAGCFSEAPPAADAAVARTAEEAGAQDGPAPAAPDLPYLAETGDEQSQGVTVYPLLVPSNAPKAPFVQDFQGEFGPESCNPVGSVPLGGLGLSNSFLFFPLGEQLTPGDVFEYRVEARYTNTDSSWADLHLIVGFGGTRHMWTDPTGDKRGEVVMNFTGQGYHVDEESVAFAGIACWYGAPMSPISVTLHVELSFASGVVPAGAPMLVDVPEGATRLFTRGVALDGERGVMSHFRLFAPDDSVVCECALGSNEETTSLLLPGPGEYVLLVDHTDNGFVSFGLDAPPPRDLLPLGTTTLDQRLAGGDGGPVDESGIVELPSVPLAMSAWVYPPGGFQAQTPDALLGRKYALHVANARGDVISQKMAGFVGARVVVPDAFATIVWYPVPYPDGEWNFSIDHHAFNLGAHEYHLQAEQLRGEARMRSIHYERPT